eukprot:g1927.t1
MFGIPRAVADVLIEEAEGDVEAAANIILMRQRFGYTDMKAYETRGVQLPTTAGKTKKLDTDVRSDPNQSKLNIINIDQDDAHLVVTDKRPTSSDTPTIGIAKDDSNEKSGSVSFHAGDRVEARWKGQLWYSARIISCDLDRRTAHLLYLDGDEDKHVLFGHIRMPLPKYKSVRLRLTCPSAKMKLDKSHSADVESTESVWPMVRHVQICSNFGSYVVSTGRINELNASGSKLMPRKPKKRDTNSRRQSEFRGVRWMPDKQMWRVDIYIRASQEKRYVGLFKCELEAAHAYDGASRKLLGNEAVTNFDCEGKRNPLAKSAPKRVRKRRKRKSGTNKRNTSVVGNGVPTSSHPKRRRTHVLLRGIAESSQRARSNDGEKTLVFESVDVETSDAPGIGRTICEQCGKMTPSRNLTCKNCGAVRAFKGRRSSRTPCYHGVRLVDKGQWTAHVEGEGLVRNIGTFTNEVDAAVARDVTLVVAAAGGNRKFAEKSATNILNATALRVCDIGAGGSSKSLTPWQIVGLRALKLGQKDVVRVEVANDLFVAKAHPKRSRHRSNGYARFTKEVFSHVRERSGGLSSKDTFVTIGKMWRELSDEKRSEYTGCEGTQQVATELVPGVLEAVSSLLDEVERAVSASYCTQ